MQNIIVHNQQHPHDIALMYYGRKIRYRELMKQVKHCVKALVAGGVKRGDCINLCVAGTPEVIYLVLACSQIGAVAAFINPMFTAQQIAEKMQETAASHLFILDALYHRAASAISQCKIKRVVLIQSAQSMPAFLRPLVRLKIRKLKIPSSLIPWKAFMHAGRGQQGVVESYLANTPLLTVFSTGSTGTPKGIVLSNDGINATIASYQHTDFRYQRGDVFLQMVPVWYSTGIVLSVLMPLCLGVSVALVPDFSVEQFVRGLTQYQASHTIVATSMWVNAMHHKKLQKADLSKLIYPVCGGEKLLPRTEDALNQFFHARGSTATCNVGWGMCELGSVAAYTVGETSSAGSAGHPILHAVIAAFNPQTNEELPYMQRGELRVISPARMLAYYQNPEATAQFFWTDKRGACWACTGDIGYVDETGDVHVAGRASDGYVGADGRQHYCFDVELIMLQDEAITHCKVLPVRLKGHLRPVAHFIRNQQHKEGLDRVLYRLDAACREALPEAARPLAYKQWDAFPIMFGKLDREALEQGKDGFMDARGKPILISL